MVLLLSADPRGMILLRRRYLFKRLNYVAVGASFQWAFYLAKRELGTGVSSFWLEYSTGRICISVPPILFGLAGALENIRLS